MHEVNAFLDCQDNPQAALPPPPFDEGGISSQLPWSKGTIDFRCTPAVLRRPVHLQKASRGRDPFLPRRDLNHETGPNGDVIFHVNITLVIGDDSACNGESEARTPSFRGEIR